MTCTALQHSARHLAILFCLVFVPSPILLPMSRAEGQPGEVQKAKAVAKAKTKSKDARKGKSETKKASKEAKEVVKSSLPPELTDHFPIGREFLGVVVPSYTGDKLKSVMETKSIVRVDEKFLDIDNLVVRIYNSNGDPETIVSMDKAKYDLTTSELISQTPSTIEQPRFIMVGDQMIFHSDTHFTQFVGNVRLVVPDPGKIAPDFGLPDQVATPTEPSAKAP